MAINVLISSSYSGAQPPDDDTHVVSAQRAGSPTTESVLLRSLVVRVASPSTSCLSTACLFDCLDDDFSCFFPRQIRHGQVRDGLPPARLLLSIDGNLSDLYCYSWRMPINDFDVSFLLLGQDITSTTHGIFMSFGMNISTAEVGGTRES